MPNKILENFRSDLAWPVVNLPSRSLKNYRSHAPPHRTRSRSHADFIDAAQIDRGCAVEIVAGTVEVAAGPERGAGKLRPA